MKKNYRKQPHQFILSSLAAAAVVCAISPPASADDPKPDAPRSDAPKSDAPKSEAPKPDAELLRLKKDLAAAGPQSELNIASSRISDYWDRKLVEVEKKVTRKLTADEQVQFAALKEQWSAYRKQEVDFIHSLFAGGTIRGFMASGAYSRITEQRVRNMESLLTGALEPRVDN